MLSLASKEGCIVIESQWWWNPRLCLPCSKGVGPRLGIVWHAPPCGVIKFNVNGVACGKSGPVGCGGVLRDHSGKILGKSNEGELRTIILAFHMIIESK
ncbi:hypothetical protein ES288_D02G096000v1 [Gossypium darwinii]|uniref:RNase H type-1 domain-containing protein n=2 Tax=Gossypium TaxID=3633 RepID=A0A5D2LVA1_GOSTO|nr:hypothetical protein ES288_D02G096000v1 [Gossypium darwinii]TYH82984.1 hypothetical protein ES332_D02G100300v1 [Gossypium tomentosum]